MDLSKYPTDESVVLLSPITNDFENLYIKLRKKEQRVYSDEEVMKLFTDGGGAELEPMGHGRYVIR